MELKCNTFQNLYSRVVDVNVQGTYSYDDANVLNDVTSSQHISQWAFVEARNGSNRLDLSRSDFAQGHRIIGNGCFSFKWGENIKSTIGIFYEGINGNPLSYIYNDNGNILADSGRETALIYVPNSRNDINLVDDGDFSGRPTMGGT